MLQEEVAYSTDEVERLTKVLDEQNSLLQASQEQAAQKDVTIKNLQQKVISEGFCHKTFQRSLMTKPFIFYQIQQQQDAVEKTIGNGSLRPSAELTVTPKSLPRVRFL